MNCSNFHFEAPCDIQFTIDPFWQFHRIFHSLSDEFWVYFIRDLSLKIVRKSAYLFLLQLCWWSQLDACHSVILEHTWRVRHMPHNFENKGATPTIQQDKGIREILFKSKFLKFLCVWSWKGGRKIKRQSQFKTTEFRKKAVFKKSSFQKKQFSKKNSFQNKQFSKKNQF